MLFFFLMLLFNLHPSFSAKQSETAASKSDLCTFKLTEDNFATDYNNLVNSTNTTLDDCLQKCCFLQQCPLFSFNISTGNCQIVKCPDTTCVNKANSTNSIAWSGKLHLVQRTENSVNYNPEKTSPSPVSTARQTSCPKVPCPKNEQCVEESDESGGNAAAASMKCICSHGFERSTDETKQCIPKSPSSSESNTAHVDITVSLGGNKELQYPTNRTNIQSTIIPEYSINDSDPYVYTWTILKKPENDQAGFDHKLGSATFSNLSPGLYTVQLSVSRGKGSLTASDVINITVNGKPKKNSKPVAVVKPNPVKITLPNSEAILNAGDSTDDNGIVSFKWDEVKRPTTAEALAIDNSDTTNQILKLSGLVAGQYVVCLTVTDAQGLTDTTNVNITVLPAIDYPPTANAGVDQIITLPTNSITLYGNLSTDDKEIVSYRWQSLQESDSLPADMTGTKTDTLHLSNLEAGTYTFVLEVEDSLGQTDSAQVHVIVEEPRDKIPKAVIVPQGPQDVYLPDSSLTLDASQSTDDKGISQYAWSLTSAPEGSVAVIEASEKAATKLLHLTVIGEYVVHLEVTDSASQKGFTDLSVVVHPDTNKAPIASAGEDLVVHWPVDVLSVSGMQSSDDGEIVYWDWAKVEEEDTPAAGMAINGSQHQPVLLLSGLIPGTYTFQLTVKDVQGVPSTDSVKITVKPPNYINNLLEIRVRVPFTMFSSAALSGIVRNIAVDLAVKDQEIFVVRVGENRQDGNAFILFYVIDQELSTIRRGLDMRDLLRRKLTSEPSRYSFESLLLDTYVCQNNCSGHGTCNSYTKQCECDGFWMENSIGRALFDTEPNCDWSVLYFTIIATMLLAVVSLVLYFVILYTNVCSRFWMLFSRSRISSSSKSSKSSSNGIGKLANGSAKKLRRRKKKLNNLEYVEIASNVRSLGGSVEVKVSSDDDSSEELFTAKASAKSSNGIPIMNGTASKEH